MDEKCYKSKKFKRAKDQRCWHSLQDHIRSAKRSQFHEQNQTYIPLLSDRECKGIGPLITHIITVSCLPHHVWLSLRQAKRDKLPACWVSSTRSRI